MIDESMTPPPPPLSGIDTIIHFPEGLLGFPDGKDYRLTAGPGDGLYWLVAMDAIGPNFVLSDPFVFFEGYSLVLSSAQSERIEADRASHVAVMAITVPGTDGEPWTANLRGPVVINVEKRIGAQLVLTDDAAALRRPFHPPLSPVAA